LTPPLIKIFLNPYPPSRFLARLMNDYILESIIARKWKRNLFLFSFCIFLLDFETSVVESGSFIADWLTPNLAAKVAAS
jgi:hypothetical protein